MKRREFLTALIAAPAALVLAPKAKASVQSWDEPVLPRRGRSTDQVSAAPMREVGFQVLFPHRLSREWAEKAQRIDARTEAIFLLVAARFGGSGRVYRESTADGRFTKVTYIADVPRAVAGEAKAELTSSVNRMLARMELPLMNARELHRFAEYDSPHDLVSGGVGYTRFPDV